MTIHYDVVLDRIDIFTIIKKIIDNGDDIVIEIDEKSLMKDIMKESRGRFNPMIVKRCIDEISY